MRVIHEQCKTNMRKLSDKDEKYNADNENKNSKFNVGDMVLKAAKINNKMNKRWDGPYRVIEVTKEGKNMKLERINRRGKPIEANIRTLKHYHKDTKKKLIQAAKDLEWAKAFVRRKEWYLRIEMKKKTERFN